MTKMVGTLEEGQGAAFKTLNVGHEDSSYVNENLKYSEN
jgi:hypothetical protein